MGRPRHTIASMADSLSPVWMLAFDLSPEAQSLTSAGLRRLAEVQSISRGPIPLDNGVWLELRFHSQICAGRCLKEKMAVVRKMTSPEAYLHPREWTSWRGASETSRPPKQRKSAVY